MSRPNFSIDLNGFWQSTNYTSGIVTNGTALGQRCSEAASGVARRKPKGWLKPTAYSFSRTAYFTEDGKHTQQRKDTFAGQFYDVEATYGNNFARDSGFGPFYGCSFIPPPSIPQSMVDRALVKARLAMKDQDVNLGVAFAEHKRTSRLVTSTALQLAKAAMSLKKGDFKGAAKALGLRNAKKPRGSSVTSRWLELQYGWKPLLGDVYGSVDALAKRDKSDWRVTGKGTIFEDVYEEAVVRPNTSAYQSGRVVMVGKKGVFVRIDALPQNELLTSLSALGVTNPLEIAWELVPFSFVADWFLPVGDYLSSLDAMLGYGPADCSISRLVKVDSLFTIDPFFEKLGSYPHTRTYRSGKSRREYVRMSRAVPDSVPLPSLPRFKDPVSLGHMANALSLLTQVFGGRR